jgi:hypothetical protein
MPVFLYDIYQKAKVLIAVATAPIRRVVAFVAAHPRTALAIWGASIYASIRYL